MTAAGGLGGLGGSLERQGADVNTFSGMRNQGKQLNKHGLNS